MKSIDNLRESLKDCIAEAGIEPNRFDTYWITAKACDMLIDEIEAEIERDYMRLPVDADGVPVKPGEQMTDGQKRADGMGIAKWDVVSVNECAFYDMSSGCHVSNMCRHVKPRTLEDVFRDCCDEYHETCKSEYTMNPADIYRKYADEARELLCGDAE